eukprot:jgi/Chlat1/6883/Chrsp51S06548
MRRAAVAAATAARTSAQRGGGSATGCASAWSNSCLGAAAAPSTSGGLRAVLTGGGWAVESPAWLRGGARSSSSAAAAAVADSELQSSSLQLGNRGGASSSSGRGVSKYDAHVGVDSVVEVRQLGGGDVVGKVVLPADVFGVPLRRDIVHRTVVWQLANRRQGSASSKSRHQVSGSGKKLGPQKGSGRARHGSNRAPQFRGGAAVHGPRPRSFACDLPKKVRRLALKVALSARLAEGRLQVWDTLEPPSIKTSDFAPLVEGFKSALLVDAPNQVNEPLRRASANLHRIDVLPVCGLNVYSILRTEQLVLSQAAVDGIVARLRAPINR